VTFKTLLPRIFCCFETYDILKFLEYLMTKGCIIIIVEMKLILYNLQILFLP
jgi:hypothetical protein